MTILFDSTARRKSNPHRRPFGSGVLRWVPSEGRKGYSRADENEYLDWLAQRDEAQRRYETGCYVW